MKNTTKDNQQGIKLTSGYYVFGNKGAVWNNAVHIAKSGEATTLCGTPMLSTNHGRDMNAGCEKCIAIYNKAKS